MRKHTIKGVSGMKLDELNLKLLLKEEREKKGQMLELWLEQRGNRYLRKGKGNQPIHTSVRNLKGVFTGWHSQDSPFWEHELFIDLTRS